MDENDTVVPTAVPTPMPPAVIHSRAFLPVIFKPEEISPKLNAAFIGWSLPGEKGSWSVCPATDIVIGPVPAAAGSEQVTLTIWAYGHGMQPVTVAINEHIVGQVTFDESITAEQLSFPVTLLHSQQNNYVSFQIPNAHSAEAFGDLRLLGIFLEKWVINP